MAEMRDGGHDEVQELSRHFLYVYVCRLYIFGN